MPHLLTKKAKASIDKITIHPAAKDAFDFYHSIDKIYGADSFKKYVTQFFEELQTLHVIKSKKELHVFSGFEHVFYEPDDLHKIHIILHEDKMDDIAISQFAWINVWKSLLSSIQINPGLAQIILSSDKMPLTIKEQLFASNKLSFEKLAGITTTHVNTARKQIEAKRAKEKAFLENEEQEGQGKSIADQLFD